MIDKSVHSRTKKSAFFRKKKTWHKDGMANFLPTSNRQNKIDSDKKRKIKMFKIFDPFNVVGYIYKKRESDISFCASS